MRGIKFNGTYSDNLGLRVQVTSNPILPQKRRHQIEIPGMDGVLDFGGNEFQRKIITMDIGVIKPTRNDYLALRRDLANWLAYKGTLILLEEPNIVYVGEIFNQIDPRKFIVSGATINLSFEVDPYAYQLITRDHTQINGIDDLTGLTEGMDYNKTL